MSTTARLFFSLLCLSFFATVSSALADYYTYTDGNGVINMTNRIDAVPKKYRSSMKVVKEEPKKLSPDRQLEQPEPARDEAASAAAPAPAPQSTFEALCDRFVWLRPLSYLAGILALFLVVLKITSVIPSPLVSRLIYVVFALGVFGFLYQAYLGNVMQQTRKAMDDAKSIVEKSKTRQESMRPEEGDTAGRK
ncbi:MAG TPA: DUF4124 domain-containing protein [Geomonas sp.]|nr:DUF4124 domain-containing protein [Geomonas sp.]